MMRPVSNVFPNPCVGWLNLRLEPSFDRIVDDPAVLTEDEVAIIDEHVREVFEDTLGWSHEGIRMALRMALRRIFQQVSRGPQDRILHWVITRAIPRWWTMDSAIQQYATLTVEYGATDTELDLFIKAE